MKNTNSDLLNEVCVFTSLKPLNKVYDHCEKHEKL